MPEFFPESYSTDQNRTRRGPDRSGVQLPPASRRTTDNDEISRTRSNPRGGSLKFIASSPEDPSILIQPKCIINCFLCLAYPQSSHQKQQASVRTPAKQFIEATRADGSLQQTCPDSPTSSTTSSIPSSTRNYTTTARSLSISSCATDTSSQILFRNNTTVSSGMAQQQICPPSVTSKSHRSTSAPENGRASPYGLPSGAKPRTAHARDLPKQRKSRRHIRGSAPEPTTSHASRSLVSIRSSDSASDRVGLLKRSRHLSEREVECLMASFTQGMQEVSDAEE